MKKRARKVKKIFELMQSEKLNFLVVCHVHGEGIPSTFMTLMGSDHFPNWTVGASGKSVAFPSGFVFEFYQITDRFIIFRIGGSDTFFCSAVFYDGSKNPMTFTLNDPAALLTFENKTDKFNDICKVCKFPSFLKLLFVESGAPRPYDASVECNIPSYCHVAWVCTACAVCEIDGNIPKACKKGYRDIFKRIEYNKKTFWARRYRKSLKIKGKREKSEEISITLKGKQDKLLLSEVNVLPTQEKFISFKLKSCHEGLIWFLPQSTSFGNDYMYYVAYIGALYNTLSTLEGSEDGKGFEFQRVSGPQVDCNNYKQFWFSWDDGCLMIGRGSIKNKDVLMSVQLECPFDIKQIGISGHNYETNWIFDTVNSNTTTRLEQKNMKVIKRYQLTLSCPPSRVAQTMETRSKIECLIICTYDKHCRRAMYKSDTSRNCVLTTGEPVRDGTRPNYMPTN
ncbi:unnamed protein product [Mytilus coruscus]|uniref:Farnesoic acid O-methyl transferase domain-containing protein n=1 Tax=Mytilus coruscus TaxID=42192 RepID=A0A6J8EPK8_MYTCO|nr:unnamed protein product [Mytilus coruscus]